MDLRDEPSAFVRPRFRGKRKPRKIGEVLTAYLRGAGLKEIEEAKRLREAWCASVSEQVGRETRLLRVRNGVVHVGVYSSSLLFELEGFRRPEILMELRKRDIGYVRDLKFKLTTPGEQGVA